jgi:hypothetical protein
MLTVKCSEIRHYAKPQTVAQDAIRNSKMREMTADFLAVVSAFMRQVKQNILLKV